MPLSPTRPGYGEGPGQIPTVPRSRYAAIVDQALLDGYHGVRAACDITPLLTDVRRREAHLRAEQVAERYLTRRPLAPLCMYDSRAVARPAAVIAVHPLHGPDGRQIALYAAGPQAAALAGDFDATMSDGHKRATGVALPSHRACTSLQRACSLDHLKMPKH